MAEIVTLEFQVRDKVITQKLRLLKLKRGGGNVRVELTIREMIIVRFDF